jgi:hypothetical protein
VYKTIIGVAKSLFCLVFSGAPTKSDKLLNEHMLVEYGSESVEPETQNLIFNRNGVRILLVFI